MLQTCLKQAKTFNNTHHRQLLISCSPLPTPTHHALLQVARALSPSCEIGPASAPFMLMPVAAGCSEMVASLPGQEPSAAAPPSEDLRLWDPSLVLPNGALVLAGLASRLVGWHEGIACRIRLAGPRGIQPPSTCTIPTCSCFMRATCSFLVPHSHFCKLAPLHTAHCRLASACCPAQVALQQGGQPGGALLPHRPGLHFLLLPACGGCGWGLRAGCRPAQVGGGALQWLAAFSHSRPTLSGLSLSARASDAACCQLPFDPAAAAAAGSLSAPC